MAQTFGKELAALIAEVDANVRHAESLTNGLSQQQFNWRPEPGRWSIGECLSHLNTVNGPDLATVKAAITAGQASRTNGTGPFRYGLLSRKFVASMEPPVTRKFKAPKYYEPPPEADLNRTLAEYRRISSEIRRLAESAKGLDLARVKTTLPTLPPLLRPLIKMPLGARLELLTTHDRRHLWQADQVRDHANFPRG